MRLLLFVILPLLLLLAGQAGAGEDPLSVRLHTQDAQRFAALFQAGQLDAAALQRGYLDGAGRGVQVFTPHRIENAANLAKAVAENRANYAHAIATCLPLADSLQAELRAVYLAYRGLLPELPLPAVHLVFGASNSGGTAAPDAQVIGLEVMCGVGTTPAQFRAGMRRIFAHETVHSWQPPRENPPEDLLLFAALMEGVPDFLASLATGQAPSPEREAYAAPREAEVWQRFEADRATVLANQQPARREAINRWFGNAGMKQPNTPEGWPSEMGYWVGMRIAAAYFERAPDKRAALRALIAAQDPVALWRASSYAPR
jgi:hypothetical protein